MTRLPPRLQPLWPLAKRIHLIISRLSGIAGRRTRRFQGDRALPGRGTESVDETAALEPARVTIHRLQVGEAIRREVPVGSPPDHWVFGRKATFDVPPAFAMEIESGVVVGEFGANLTPGGTLDNETSEYFGTSGWREHPLFLRRRLPPIQEEEGTVVVLAARGGSSNYYHFLLDVLPRFGVFEQAMPDRRPDALYVPCAARYQQILLKMVGLSGHRFIPAGKEVAVRAERLVVPSLPNTLEVAPTATVEWLRSKLPPMDRSDKPRRIYVTRGDTPRTRRLVREAETMELLEQRGFVRVEPAGLSPQEQIDLFAAADVVVAPHGAAMTNLLFLSPGARVLEMFAPNYVNSAFWAISQGIPDVVYHYLIADGAERHGVGDPMNKIQADIDLDPRVIAAAVDALIEA